LLILKIEGKEGVRSFVREGSLYIYGGYSRGSKVQVNFKELWALNLGKVHLIRGQKIVRNNAVEKNSTEKI